MPSNSKNSVFLKKASRWFQKSNDEISNIEIRAQKLDSKVSSYNKTIVRLGMIPPAIEDRDRFNLIQSPPTFLTVFVLSPFVKNGIFSKIKNRKIFQKRLANLNYPRLMSEINLYRANYFYESAPSKVEQDNLTDDQFTYSGEEVVVNTPFLFGPQVAIFFNELIFQLLSEVSKNKIHINEFNFSNEEFF